MKSEDRFGTHKNGDKLRHILTPPKFHDVSLGGHQAHGCSDSATCGGRNGTLYFDQDQVAMVSAYTLCLTRVWEGQTLWLHTGY